MKRIPFNRACLQGKELDYISEALNSGHIMGDGPFTKKCQEFIERELGAPKVLLTTSCTHALEMTALLLDIQPGDEVIVPSFTFVSTVNAFVLRGARPVFIDIRRDTLNMDESLLEPLVTPKTKAILAMHYGGVACEMDAIMKIAEKHGIPVVEDNANGLFGRYGERFLGTFGCLATQSFHETKNFTCGEGGALIINDPKYIEGAEIVREKGTDRSRFFRGQVDKYTWVNLGSSYVPSDMNAAFLYAQLEAADRIQGKRQKIWEYYHQSLRGWTRDLDATLPTVPEHCEQAYHLYYILMPSLDMRQSMIAHLNKNGIGAVFHYLPLHLSRMGMKFGGKKGDCPVTEDVSDRLLRLPFYYELTEKDQERVVEAIHDFHF